MRVGAEIETQVCAAPKSDSFPSAIQGVFQDHELKARFGLGFASDELCNCEQGLYILCCKRRFGNNFSPHLIVNCPIFS